MGGRPDGEATPDDTKTGAGESTAPQPAPETEELPEPAGEPAEPTAAPEAQIPDADLVPELPDADEASAPEGTEDTGAPEDETAVVAVVDAKPPATETAASTGPEADASATDTAETPSPADAAAAEAATDAAQAEATTGGDASEGDAAVPDSAAAPAALAVVPGAFRFGPAGGAAPRRSPHPALIPLMVLGTAFAVLLAFFGTLGTPGVRDILDHAAATSSAPPAPSGTSPAATPTPTATPQTEIKSSELKAIAEAQTAALQSGDLAAFLAPYEPTATELVAERTRLFANLRLITFEQAQFRWERVVTGSLVGSSTGPVTVEVTVDFVHQIAGVDVAPTRSTYRMTVLRAGIGAPLRITHVRNSDPLAWDLADLVKVERPHVILLADKVDKAKAGTWADRAEAAAKRDLELWKGPAEIPSRFIVFASPDAATFGKAYGGDAPKGTVAFCSPMMPAEYASGGTRRVVGSRITWDTDAKGMSNYDAQTGVMRHEMGHALMAGFTNTKSSRTPLWVVEGFAEYLEWADLFGEYYAPDARNFVRSGKFSGKLPADDDIYGEDPEANGINYHLSMTAIRYMVDKHGAAKTFAFVVSVYQEPTAVDEALKAATGLDRAAFEAKWAQWLKSHI
ncbi:peptidase MA family metallohydrolase [Yinghuangia soli]|uniref:Peptidase MA-like domain-containing protein n=1 Tax=Yinghuangia soli TaxID=2908204 RepID=A0AA41Q9J6_9ACTN|nr:hypothetical protein [Yinghuangia soli]MCF2533741.1 hypothetical protein [Yinghuangia soli]